MFITVEQLKEIHRRLSEIRNKHYTRKEGAIRIIKWPEQKEHHSDIVCQHAESIEFTEVQ